MISRYRTGKHFDLTITDTTLTVQRRQDQIDAEAALDGFYVLRIPVPAARLDAPGVVAAYKNLGSVERDFRSIKSDDLDLRPVFHRLEERVKAHVLICVLACYITWHLRRAWAPLTFTDEHPPARGNPVIAAHRRLPLYHGSTTRHLATVWWRGPRDPVGLLIWLPVRLPAAWHTLRHRRSTPPQPGPGR